MSISLSEGWIKDVRDPVAGDSYNWSGTEPAAAKKAIIIHHSGSNTNLNGGAEDAFSIANFHVNSRGWGGIGYHFVITHDSHSGGAQVQYAGDLLTWRAHLKGLNNGKVGICLVGNFLEQLPGPNQLRLARQLVDFLMAPNNILPSINYYSQIYPHGQYPNQQTAGEQCPGFAGPHFAEWYGYIKGGAFPENLYSSPTPTPVIVPTPEPTPTPQPIPQPEPTPEPVPDPEPQPVPTVEPEWQSSYVGKSAGELEKDTTPLEIRTVERADTFAVDMTGSGEPKPIAVGTQIQIAGYFGDNGKTYARTVWNVTTGWPKLGQWYGVDEQAFIKEPTGQVPETDIPVRVIPKVSKGWLALSKVIANIIGAVLRTLKLRSKSKS